MVRSIDLDTNKLRQIFIFQTMNEMRNTEWKKKRKKNAKCATHITLISINKIIGSI